MDSRIQIILGPMGWRYRVGDREDGNYLNRSDAVWAAETWLKEHPPDQDARPNYQGDDR
jgi:hypothetical protein